MSRSTSAAEPIVWLFRLFLFAVFSLFAAHALAYVFVTALPSAAQIALGIESLDATAMAAFEQQRPPRTYLDSLSTLIVGDLGNTLDRLPVRQVIIEGLSHSIGRIFFAIIIIFISICTVAVTVSRIQNWPLHFLFFAAFVPFFLPAIVFLLFSLIFIVPFSEAAAWWSCTLAIAFPPAALGGAQTALLIRGHLEQDYTRTLRAMGAGPLRLRLALVPNLIATLTPSFEKMTNSLLITAVFAEPIFGVQGFGATAFRALRRSDSDLILGVVIAFVFAVNLSRIMAALVRRHYRIDDK